MRTLFIIANKKIILFLLPVLFLFHSCNLALYNPFIEDTYQAEPATTPVPGVQAAFTVMDPPGGTYDSDQNVTIICETTGVIIRYTTDGTDPDENSAVYSAPIPVTGNGTTMTIKAYAEKEGMIDSIITTEAYSINYDQVSTPVMNPSEGTYNSDQSITITCGTTGAIIYYTTDGTDPDESSDVYSSPIPVTGPDTILTIKAYAVKAGLISSTLRSGVYTIRYPYILSITSSTDNGTYGIGVEIDVTVTFSEPVILSGGTLTISLDTGAVAVIDPFGPADAVSCTYTINSGESSADLDSSNITLDGGTLLDTAGNPVFVSLPSTTINDGSNITVDGIRPVISSFTLTSGSPTTSHFLSFTLDGSDSGAGITHWLINESAARPAADDPGWVSVKPDSYTTTPEYEAKTVYAWAKDGAANVSDTEAASSFDVIVEYTGDSSWTFEKSASSEDLPTGATIDYDDNIYIVGLKQNTTSDWQIIKVLPDGTEDTANWNKQIDWYGASDCAQGIVTDSANNVYVCGYFKKSSDDMWGIKKFNSTGNELWSKEWNNDTGSDIAQGISIDSMDNIYVVGFITDPSSGLDWWMKKYDADGTEDTTNWNFGFDNGYGGDTAVSVSIDSSDNVYVAGTVLSPNGDVDWMVRKYTSNGSFVWSRQYNRASNNKTDRAYTITVDSSDYVYAAGYSTSSSDNVDWAIKKYDSDGNEDTANWDKTVDQGANDVVWGIGTDKNNNVYVGGRLLYADNDWAVIKYDSSGTELWRDVISNTGADWCRGIVVDSMNYAFGIGGMYRSGGGTDWYIKKYAP